MYFNANSIRNKRDQINALLNYIENLSDKCIVHAILITETHLKSEEIAIFDLNGYTSFHSTRMNDRKGGGVSIYLHNTLTGNVLFEKSDQSCNYLVIKIIELDKNISCVYRAPDSDVNDFLAIFDQSTLSLKNNYIFGDINIDLLKTYIDDTLTNYMNCFSCNGYVLLNKKHIDFAT